MALSGAETGIGAERTAYGSVLPGRRWSWLTREMELTAAGALILAGSAVYPYLSGILDRATPGCLFHRVTGIPCLLCGMTRSLSATAHGRLDEAFRLHLLGPPAFVLVAALTLVLGLELILSRPLLPRPGKRSRRILGWGVLGLLVAAWAARLALFGVNV